MAAPSEKTGGTQSATLTTEHTLATITDAGRYQLTVNLTNMANGATPDIVEIRQKIKVRSGGSEVEEKLWSLGPGAQSEKVFRPPPIPSPHSVKYTLKQTQGSAGRDFEWSVIDLG